MDRELLAAMLVGTGVGALLGFGFLILGSASLEKKIRDGRAEIDRAIASGRQTAYSTVPSQVRAGIDNEINTKLAQAHLTPADVRAMTGVLRSLGL